MATSIFMLARNANLTRHIFPATDKTEDTTDEQPATETQVSEPAASADEDAKG